MTTPTAPPDEILPPWAPAAILGLVSLAMLAWTWGRWPDVMVDFGMQLYVPWQLTEGKVLYRDMAYFTGPLSPYLNALWFLLFGVGVRTLVLCNIAIFAVVLVLLYRVLRSVAGRSAATAACVVFVAVFAFGHMVPLGNYNFVCPYSHEMTHGLALGLGAMLCLLRHFERRDRPSAIGAGVLLGLVVLTRAELSLPALAAAALGLAAMLAMDPGFRSTWRGLLVQVGGPALGVPLIAFALLRAAMPAGAALRGVAGSWVWVLDPAVTSLPFYREASGLGDVSGNLARLFAWAAVEGLALLVVSGAALAVRGGRTWPRGVVVLAAAVTAAAVAWRWPDALAENLGRPLPLFMAAAVLAAGAAFLRGRRDAGTVRWAMLATFALALLAKIALDARLYQYGFVLAAPATMLVVLGLLDRLPAAVAKRGGDGSTLRIAGLVLLAGLVAVHVQVSGRFLAGKTVRVGGGPDAFLADSRGAQVNAVLEFLAREVPAGRTLAVFPHGLMFNYLARRVNPNACMNTMPPELVSLGEDAVLAAFERTPPDVVVVNLDEVSRAGLLCGGEPFAPKIAAWLYQRHRLVARFESPPDDPRPVRIGVLVRNLAAPPTPARLAGLDRVRLLEGDAAAQVVARLHGRTVAPEDTAIAVYGTEALVVYLSRYGSHAEAQRTFDAMLARLRGGGTPFTRPVAVPGREGLWSTEGPGGQHALWNAGGIVYWLQAAEGPVLERATRELPLPHR